MDNHVSEMHKRVGNDFKVDPETTYYLHVEPDIHGDLATLTMYHRLYDSDSNRYIDEIDFAMHHNLDSVVETCSIIRSVVSKLVCILSRWCTAVLAEKLKALGITAVVSNEYIASVISTIIEEEKLKMERKMSEKNRRSFYFTCGTKEDPERMFEAKECLITEHQNNVYPDLQMKVKSTDLQGYAVGIKGEKLVTWIQQEWFMEKFIDAALHANENSQE